MTRDTLRRGSLWALWTACALPALLAAWFAWADVAVPPYCPKTEGERAALRAFEDEVIDRLFALNAERAGGEERARRAGAG